MLGIFNKRKKRKQEELDASFEKVMTEIARIDDWENPQRLQHYILDSCEQIVATTKVIEQEKKEYQALTSYLQDVSKLTDQPPRQRKMMSDCVKKLKDAEKAKDDYAKVTHRMSDAQFAMMERNERFVVDDIKSMMANEVQQSKVQRDMRVLEAKKSEHEIEREQVATQRAILKKAIIGVFAGGISLCILFMLLHYALEINMTMAFLLLFLGIVLFMLYLFYANSHLSRTNKQALVGLNKTISLLNVVRMKYANVTGSIKYTQTRYHVTSAHELNYLYDCYMEEARIRKKNEQDNEDFKYFYGRLLRMLGELDLHDRRVWLDQLDALADPEELDKVKNGIKNERANLRAQIDDNTRIVQSERDEVSRLMRDHDYYPPEIVEIISRVDRMCGLNMAYKFVN